MSEKVYAWLLRLFPAGFLEAYGKEALELFRDRWRDERGLFLRLRLWGDLLADLLIAIPREYRFARTAWSGQSARSYFGAIPGFHVLAGDPIRPTSLVLGGVLAAVALGGLAVLSGQVSTDLDEAPSILPKHSADARYGPVGWAVASLPGAGIADTPAEKVFKPSCWPLTAETRQQWRLIQDCLTPARGCRGM